VQPLAGMLVVDLTRYLPGAFASRELQRLGARVVRVEPPEGDPMRHTAPAWDAALSAGKESVAVDLKTDPELARALCARADVVLEGFRPGVAARLGVGYADIAALSPRVIYLSVSGFGQAGPDAERPAVDTVFQAFTGIMSVNRGADGIPHRVGVIVIDMATALASFQAVAVSLYARRDEPRGRYIESSLLRGGSTVQTVSMIQHHLEGGKPQPGLTPSGTFKARDGWINLTILRDGEFRALCDALDLPAVKADPRFATNDSRFAHVADLNAALEPAFASRPVADLAARLRGARLMHQRVNTYLEFLEDPHVKATGAVTWIEQPGLGRLPVPSVPGLPPLVSGSPRAVAPSLDQHRKEILAELERDA
jgi:crotonobetainyl-CoA:carnitine CoA-transferase CaiB-like acyl-CoA transferase